MDLKTAELYVQLRSYKALVEKTNAFISESLGKVKNPYVACSFGKDSSVMLDLIIKHNKNIPVVCVLYKESELLNNYIDVINCYQNINLTILNVENCKILEEHNEVKEMEKLGFDSAFVGIRKEESKQRRIALLKNKDFYKQNNGIYRIAPLSNWTLKDISAYIITNNIPTLKTYSDGFESRTTTGYSKIGEERMLENLKRTDIVRYNLLIKKIKEEEYGTSEI